MILMPEASPAPSLLPDMTALLDVLFILLIFMMLTANAAPHLLQLDLPEAQASASRLDARVITLGISEQGKFSIDQTSFETWLLFTGELKARLARSTQSDEGPVQVLVAADKDVALNSFVKLAQWLSLQGHGVAEIVVSDQDKQ